MRFALCDDNTQDLNHLTALLADYETNRGVRLECQTFHSGTELLCGMKGGEYDVILLDMLMPGISGIETAQELRGFDQTVKLLFLSASPEFAVDSYSVGAYYYLLKPATAQTLFPLLDKIITELYSQPEEGLLLKGRDGVVRVPFSRLEYVEVMNKTVSFHLTDGSVREVSAALADFEEELLGHSEFSKVHRSFLLNLRHVQSVGAKGAVTRMGHTVPVSRSLYPQVKDAYMYFLFQNDVAIAAPDLPIVQTPLQKKACQEGVWRILLVDDEAAERSFWAEQLCTHGCVVDTAEGEAEAQRLAASHSYHCMVLDVKLAGESGFDLCGRLQNLTGAPVIFLSSFTDEESQLQGFFSGCVDYITKDTPTELFWAKVETRIKLSRAGRTQMRFGPLLLDLARRKVMLEERDLVMTPTEFDLLWLLSEHAGRVYTPEELYHAVWGAQQWDGGQTVQVHMSRLRRKLEKAYSCHYFIETVWGKGYRFVPVSTVCV